MDDACGRDNEGHPRYNVELSEVDLFAISDKTKEEAFKSCGGFRRDQAEPTEVEIADAVSSYGAKAPLGSWNGNALRVLMRQARKRAAEMDDPVVHETAMNSPVNAIGSTALEFMKGDINSAMVRGVAEGRQDAKLMARMYGAKPEDLQKVEGKLVSDDPLAYQMGYVNGFSGTPMEKNDPKNPLAPEYIRGFKYGEDVKAGRATPPDWIKHG